MRGRARRHRCENGSVERFVTIQIQQRIVAAMKEAQQNKEHAGPIRKLHSGLRADKRASLTARLRARKFFHNPKSSPAQATITRNPPKSAKMLAQPMASSGL